MSRLCPLSTLNCQLTQALVCNSLVMSSIPTRTPHHPAGTPHAKYPSNVDHGSGGHLIDGSLPGGPARGFDPEKGIAAHDTVSSDEEAKAGGLKRGDKHSAVREKVLTGDDASSELVQIVERQLSWQQAAALLFTEYVVLAILAFPYSFQILGMAGGVISTVIIGLSVLYTSHVLWRFCMQYPEIRDICDAAYIVAGRSRIAWGAAFIGLALNNWFIMGLHLNAATTAVK